MPEPVKEFEGTVEGIAPIKPWGKQQRRGVLFKNGEESRWINVISTDSRELEAVSDFMPTGTEIRANIQNLPWKNQDGEIVDFWIFKGSIDVLKEVAPIPKTIIPRREPKVDYRGLVVESITDAKKILSETMSDSGDGTNFYNADHIIEVAKLLFDGRLRDARRFE